MHYPLVTDMPGLMWMANQNTVTPHVWVSRVPAPRHPDLCAFDLDPPADYDPHGLRTVALALRDLLVELGLRSWVKTSASKGFHVVLSLDATAKTGVVAKFADAVGALLIARHPESLTSQFSKADRGRILVDTGRNGRPARATCAPRSS